MIVKRYVKEFARDCIRDIAGQRINSLNRALAERFLFVYDAKDQDYSKLPESVVKDIEDYYRQKKERILNIVEQCEYGYITEFYAIKFIVKEG